MGLFVMAWLVGEGIIVYRSAKIAKAPPGPGQLLVTSGVFVLLGLLAEAGDGGRRLATTLAVGFDIAAFMTLRPGNIGDAVGSVTGVALSKNVGNWPPPKAPDTVILPAGTQ